MKINGKTLLLSLVLPICEELPFLYISFFVTMSWTPIVSIVALELEWMNTFACGIHYIMKESLERTNTSFLSFFFVFVIYMTFI